MKKYKVLRNCWGYKGKPWWEGRIVEFADDDTPPHHFEFIGTTENQVSDPPKATVIPEHKDVMAPQLAEVGKPVYPEGGFASSHEFVKPVEVETASQAFKKRGRPKKVE